VFLRKSAVPLDSKRFALHSLLEERKEEQKSADVIPTLPPPPICMNIKTKELQKLHFVSD
jgi:hypothetical protein